MLLIGGSKVVITSGVTASQLVAIENDGHRPLVAQFNAHGRAEDAAGHGQPVGGEGLFELLVQWDRERRGRGPGKARSATAFHIGVEGKLRDYQDLSMNIEQ